MQYETQLHWSYKGGLQFIAGIAAHPDYPQQVHHHSHHMQSCGQLETLKTTGRSQLNEDTHMDIHTYTFLYAHKVRNLVTV